MRRGLLFLILFILSATAIVSAQEDQPGATETPPWVEIHIPRDPEGPGLFGPLQGVWAPVELEEVEPPVGAPSMTLGHAADECVDAPVLAMEQGTDGDLSTVNEMTSSASDPVLSCMVGSPSRLKGYRTVWYKFQAPDTGWLTVTTDLDPSDYEDGYDTVVALYHSPDASCDSLRQLACDDDTHGFYSQISTLVTEGETYYVEVADWQLESNVAATLRLSIVLEEAEPFWERMTAAQNSWIPRSRHMVVSYGGYLYIIGGERAVEPFPDRDVPSVVRFDPRTATWTDLNPSMPPLLPFPNYSRTTAALLDGRIYIPAGYVGNNDFYDGTHWVYDIAQNRWFRSTRAPWPNGQPYAWSQAVSVPASNGYFLTGGLLAGDPDPSFPANAVPTNRLLFFRPDPGGESGFWNANLPGMDIARYAHVAALLQTPAGPRICVAGGVTREAEAAAARLLAHAECYNPASGTWQPISPLPEGRFSAGSAVGPDGRWYVFGGVGVDQEGGFVAATRTAVYDPASDTWQLLDGRYSLKNPGRAWPRGAFVNETLWAFGGEEVLTNDVIPLVERLFLPQQANFFPLTLKGGDTIEPNDTFAQARFLPLGQPQTGDFSIQNDFFDVYRFNAPSTGFYEVLLTSIPSSHNYDVYIYDGQYKQELGRGVEVGDRDERVVTNQAIPPGSYYIFVVRVFGQTTTNSYRVEVRPR